jgi:hypothetical protein
MMRDVRLEPTIFEPRSYQNSLYGNHAPGQILTAAFLRIDQIAILSEVFFPLEVRGSRHP